MDQKNISPESEPYLEMVDENYLSDGGGGGRKINQSSRKASLSGIDFEINANHKKSYTISKLDNDTENRIRNKIQTSFIV